MWPFSKCASKKDLKTLNDRLDFNDLMAAFEKKKADGLGFFLDSGRMLTLESYPAHIGMGGKHPAQIVVSHSQKHWDSNKYKIEHIYLTHEQAGKLIAAIKKAKGK